MFKTVLSDSVRNGGGGEGGGGRRFQNQFCLVSDFCLENRQENKRNTKIQEDQGEAQREIRKRKKRQNLPSEEELSLKIVIRLKNKPNKLWWSNLYYKLSHIISVSVRLAYIIIFFYDRIF